MDLCTGAKKVIIATDHTNRKGESKILKKCRLPLTAQKEANLIVTELAVLKVTLDGLLLKEVAPGISIDEVKSKTEADLIIPEVVKTMTWS